MYNGNFIYCDSNSNSVLCSFFCVRTLQMRQEMVQQKEGEMELTVLTHMDDMKRVSLRTQK